MTLTLLLAGTAFAGPGFINKLLAWDSELSDEFIRVGVGVQYKFTYDDNIYSAPSKPKKDRFSTLAPGIAIGINTERTKLDAGVTADQVRYQNEKENNFDGSAALVRYSFNSYGGIKLKADDTYTENDSPLDENPGYKRLLNERNDFNATASYEFTDKRTTLEIGFSAMDLDYDDLAHRDKNREEYKAKVALDYKLLPKTTMTLKAEYADNDYVDSGTYEARDADSATTNLMVGLKWAPGAKILGEVFVGSSSRDYEAVYNGTYYYKDEDTPRASARLEYNVSGNTAITFNAVHQVDHTTYAGVATKFSPAHSYLHSGGALGFKFSITGKIGVEGKASYYADEYEDLSTTAVSREDKIKDGEFLVRYEMNRWFNAAVTYNTHEVDSNDNTGDVYDEKVMLTLQALVRI